MVLQVPSQQNTNMPKKITKKKKEVVEEIKDTDFELNPNAEDPVITPITHDFGREDLNQLRDKLNEVISKI